MGEMPAKKMSREMRGGKTKLGGWEMNSPSPLSIVIKRAFLTC
jgi:hypothetical protein